MIELVMRRLLLACLSLARKYALIVMLMRGRKKYPETEPRWVFISNFFRTREVRITGYHQGIVSYLHRAIRFFSFFPSFLFLPFPVFAFFSFGYLFFSFLIRNTPSTCLPLL